MSVTATRERASSNGRATDESDHFPVDSFKEAARHLRRPFTRAAVKFKVQATWPKDAPTGGLIVSYIDARLAVERLNLIVPHLWFDEYQPLEGGRLLCRLTVDGITRHDIGDGYQGKGLYSDALKRAAVKFGVGVSLYATPAMMLKKSDGHLKDARSQKGPTLALTPQGEARCRELYQAWLDTVGIEAFGEPLSHGDVEDSQGDADAPEEIITPDEPVATNGQPIDQAAAKQLDDQYARYQEAGKPFERLEMQAAALGGELDTSGAAMWSMLTVEQGRALYRWMHDEIVAEVQS